MITPHLLTQLGVSTRAAEWAAALAPACQAHGITTRLRVAAFLATVLHESDGFTILGESLNYSAAALLAKFGRHRISVADAQRLGRKPGAPALSLDRQAAIGNIIYGGAFGLKHLGNTQPGDGWRFRGLSIMQHTGRAERERLAKAWGCTLDEVAERLQTIQGGALAAANFWQHKGCNGLADVGDTEGWRRKVNGGLNGYADVLVRYQAALRLLPNHDAPAPAPVQARPATALAAGAKPHRAAEVPVSDADVLNARELAKVRG